MDDFREWLSDNLRYFELGCAALAVVIAAVFGVRGVINATLGGSQKESPAVSVNEQMSTGETVVEKRQEVVEEAPVQENENTGTAVSNPLTVAETAITSLVRSYYQSIGEKDVEAVRALVDELAPEDEPGILNSDFQDYLVDNVFTKNGLTDNEKAVFVEYSYKVAGIDTAIPVSSWLYVFKDSEGVWRIDGDALTDSRVSTFLDSLNADADVIDRTARIQGLYDAALMADQDLNDYMLGLGAPSADVSSDSESADDTGADNADSPDHHPEADPEQTESGEDAEGSQDTQESGETDTSEESGETKAASEENIEGTYPMLTLDYVNVRDAAGGGDVIGGFDEGVVIRAYGTVGEWTEVYYEGQRAYIYSEYLANAE